MKKIKAIVLAGVTLFSGFTVFGQAKEVSVMIEKENRTAIMIAIEQPEKNTREALQQRLERSGLKERSKTGIISYKGVTLSEISPDKIDVYTKVEKGPNNGSIVYMAVSRGYNNFTNGTNDTLITENIKAFLQAFVKDAEKFSADLGINNQINDVNSDEKAYQRLLEEQKDLQNRKVNIDNKLSQIQADINALRESIDKKKAGVEDSKAKRSSTSGL